MTIIYYLLKMVMFILYYLYSNTNLSRSSFWGSQIKSVNLNTSHVFIYPFPYSIFVAFRPFKYISCFYLSEPKAIVKPFNNNLNTSHVFIYPNQEYKRYILHVFKYISCFYLSKRAMVGRRVFVI